MKILFFVVVLCMVYTVYGDCDLPPSLWCSSGEIAKKCGVYDQCSTSFRLDPFAGPVNLTLYFESLCPDCKQFISEQLYDTWKVLGEEVVNLTLVPYGNAHESKGIEEWKFECQHGKEECVGNLIETCAISILAKKSVYVPFIYCMEKAFTMPEQSAKECATQLGIDLDPIMKCSTSSMGNELEHQMALLTDALNPPHKYVPWIVINGIHTEPLQNKAQSHLLKVICEMYKGDTPQACKQFSKSSGRCYRD